MKFNISLKVLPLLACGMLMASCNDFLKQEPHRYYSYRLLQGCYSASSRS